MLGFGEGGTWCSTTTWWPSWLFAHQRCIGVRLNIRTPNIHTKSLFLEGNQWIYIWRRVWTNALISSFVISDHIQYFMMIIVLRRFVQMTMKNNVFMHLFCLELVCWVILLLSLIKGVKQETFILYTSLHYLMVLVVYRLVDSVDSFLVCYNTIPPLGFTPSGLRPGGWCAKTHRKGFALCT